MKYNLNLCVLGKHNLNMQKTFCKLDKFCDNSIKNVKILNCFQKFSYIFSIFVSCMYFHSISHTMKLRIHVLKKMNKFWFNVYNFSHQKKNYRKCMSFIKQFACASFSSSRFLSHVRLSVRLTYQAKPVVSYHEVFEK